MSRNYVLVILRFKFLTTVYKENNCLQRKQLFTKKVIVYKEKNSLQRKQLIVYKESNCLQRKKILDLAKAQQPPGNYFQWSFRKELE